MVSSDFLPATASCFLRGTCRKTGPTPVESQAGAGEQEQNNHKHGFHDGSVSVGMVRDGTDIQGPLPRLVLLQTTRLALARVEM